MGINQDTPRLFMLCIPPGKMVGNLSNSFSYPMCHTKQLEKVPLELGEKDRGNVYLKRQKVTSKIFELESILWNNNSFDNVIRIEDARCFDGMTDNTVRLSIAYLDQGVGPLASFISSPDLSRINIEARCAR